MARPTALYIVCGLPFAGKSSLNGHCFAREQRARLRAIARRHAAPATLIFVATPERLARERWLANRRDPQRHDVPDALFARAAALPEMPGGDELPVRYDGTLPVAAWVARLQGQ